MSSTATIAATLIALINLITGTPTVGTTYDYKCPENAVWQWYPEHGLYGCGTPSNH